MLDSGDAAGTFVLPILVPFLLTYNGASTGCQLLRLPQSRMPACALVDVLLYFPSTFHLTLALTEDFNGYWE